MATTWECPRCHRRVPLRIAECHCGTARPEDAARVAAGKPVARRTGPGGAEEVPVAVWAWVALMVLTTLVGLFWALRPADRNRIVPLLGHVDRAPERPSPQPPSPPAK